MLRKLLTGGQPIEGGSFTALLAVVGVFSMFFAAGVAKHIFGDVWLTSFLFGLAGAVLGILFVSWKFTPEP